MCGRYVLAQDLDRYAEYFRVDEVLADPLPPSYNVAPTDPVYGVAEHGGRRQLGAFRWGLLPFWAPDRRRPQINARLETLTEKPTFRDALSGRRCLIPADGFYEWEQGRRGKLPYFIYLAEGAPMAFAGLWSRWTDPETGERLTTCAIITGRPNRVVEGIHDRMPIPLLPSAWDPWLDRELDDPEQVLALIEPVPEAGWRRHPVSSLVNSVRNNLPECIAPLPPSP